MDAQQFHIAELHHFVLPQCLEALCHELCEFDNSDQFLNDSVVERQISTEPISPPVYSRTDHSYEIQSETDGAAAGVDNSLNGNH